MKSHPRLPFQPALLALCLLSTLLPAIPAFAAGASKSEDTVTLNFTNAEIEGVARTLSEITRHNVVVDPRVKGTLSLNTDTPVSPARAWEQFLSALRLQGFTVIEAGGLYKIVPETEGKLQSTSVTVGPARSGGDQIATEIFKLNYANGTNLLPVLRPLISPNNVINLNSGNNSLVVTDYASNLTRLRAIVSALDTPSATDVEVMPLHNTMAAEMAVKVLKLSSESSAGADAAASAPSSTPGAAATPGVTGGSSGGLSVVADTQSNSLLVRAPNRAQLAAVRALVAQLDRARDNVNVRVVYLKNTEATRIAQVLRAAFPSDTAGAGGAASGGTSASASSGLPAAAAAAASSSSASSSGSSKSSGSTQSVTASAQPTTGGGIQADPASNSLIITAPESRFREMRPIIEQLDSRRAQLYVESLVVEVDASKGIDLGVQWSELFDYSSSTTLTLGTVAEALESMTGTNILSTANVVTLDNEEAKVVVGQNVPYITGSYTTSTNSNPFQTVERKDVGITLRIRPQIGADGNIRMTIYQESSSVASTSTTLGPTTNQRSVETTVTVNDGKIIALGGLIEDSYTDSAYQIPWVADLPVIGNIFRSISRTHKKTNLLVFLRPVIMRDDGTTTALSMDRYDYIGARQRAMPKSSADLPQSFDTQPLVPPVPMGALPMQ